MLFWTDKRNGLPSNKHTTSFRRCWRPNNVISFNKGLWSKIYLFQRQNDIVCLLVWLFLLNARLYKMSDGPRHLCRCTPHGPELYKRQNPWLVYSLTGLTWITINISHLLSTIGECFIDKRATKHSDRCFGVTGSVCCVLFTWNLSSETSQ